MKKTISTTFALVLIVLLVAVIVGASHRWGYTRYGGSYYSPQYSNPFYDSPYYYPYADYPYVSQYQALPAYASPYYYSPLSSPYLYRYGSYKTTPYTEYSRLPTVSYPAAVVQPRGVVGQPCGMIDNAQYGCVYGLTCDYNAASDPGIGICTRS